MSTGTAEGDRPSIPRKELKQVIYQHRGRERAVSSKELAHRFGDKATNVRDAVQDLVRDGALIASCERGYYRIASADEVSDEIDSLLAEAETRRERALTLRREWQALEADLGVKHAPAVESPRGPITAAEVAVADDHLERAENALLEALSRVRRARVYGRDHA